MSGTSQTRPPTNDLPQGSAHEWDAIWQKYSANDPSMRKLFTRGNPATIYQFWQRCYFEDLLHTVNPQSDWKFLELASGRGTTSMYLASRGMGDITLVDLSATALQQAKENFAVEKLPPPQLVQAYAENTGLREGQYDCLYNVGVLEHFTDPSKILVESRRLLRPGGRIFMPIVPALPFARSLVCRTFFNPLSIVKRIAKWFLRKPSVNKNPDMVRTTTGRTEYCRIAEAAGLVDVSCVPYNPYWKVNRDGSAVERFLTLPLYKLHQAIKRSFGFRPSLKTWNATASCYLLVASRPKGGERTQINSSSDSLR